MIEKNRAERGKKGRRERRDPSELLIEDVTKKVAKSNNSNP